LSGLAGVRLRLGEPQLAGDLLDRTLAIHRETGNRNGQANVLDTLGQIAAANSRYDTARTHLTEARDLYDALADTMLETRLRHSWTRFPPTAPAKTSLGTSPNHLPPQGTTSLRRTSESDADQDALAIRMLGVLGGRDAGDDAGRGAEAESGRERALHRHRSARTPCRRFRTSIWLGFLPALSADRRAAHRTRPYPHDPTKAHHMDTGGF